MNSTMNPLPPVIAPSNSVVRLGAPLLLALSLIAGTAAQNNQNSNSGKRQHVTTLRSSDSQEGSRVAISSDQSLNNYEAYRRGDRFYVKIPAADVPRAEAVRGRGFADVKAQRNGDSTLLSFRLQPGATAHVEQHSNKLDVVVTIPGGSGANANRPRETAQANKQDFSRPGEVIPSAPKSSNANESRRANPAPTPQVNANRNKKPALVPTATPSPKPAASPAASAAIQKASPTAKPTATVPLRPLTAIASPTVSPAAPINPPAGDLWSRLKERGHYWLLLAQLNPIPVAIGAALLILIIGLLLAQRRRARGTRRPKRASSETIRASSAPVAAAVATPVAAFTAEPEPKPESPVVAPVATIPVPAAMAAETAAVTAVPQPVLPVTPAPAAPAPVDDTRRDRVNRVADEARKMFDGAPYDEAIIGSEDRDTRRLVGAELLSALVGRNPARRERAREAFMKFGYFDDATRDLRVAESDNERAAAARRLSFVHDREATPHLLGALGDPSPDVRRASVEALMDLRDPSAIGPLNSLLQTENDRKVPRTLIKHAIEACATSQAFAAPAPPDSPAPQSIDTEREVIEL